MKVHDGGFQLVSNHDYTGTSLGVALVPRGRRDLHLPGAAHRAAVPAHHHPRAQPRDTRAYFAWILLLEAAVMGSFLSLDLLVFFLFFELTLVPAYFIIAGWGHQRRAYAADQVLPLHVPGLGLPAGGDPGAGLHPPVAVPLPHLLAPAADAHPPVVVDGILSSCLHGGLRGQGAALPVPHLVARRLHRGPRGGLGLLSGVLAKLGTYGIIRFDLNLFPQATRTLAPLLLTLAVIGILYGAIVACAQRDMKRLVAYSSLAQIGFIALGTFALSTPGPGRRGAADGQPRPRHRRALPPRSASSTSGAAPGRSASCAGSRRRPRPGGACSPSP